MKNLKNKSGFTLIEIIVVLIIVGVLAAIALPNLFSNITRSGAAEGIAALGPYKSQIEGCMMGHANSENANCTITFSNTANFGYSFATAIVNGSSGGNYVLQASSLGTPANFITLTKSTVGSGTLNCAGAGAYTGAC